MFHLSRSRGFMSHGALQRLLRFDVCASVTVFQLKQADGSMSVSDRRGKATRRRLHGGSKIVPRTPWKADKEKTNALQNQSTIHARCECTEERREKNHREQTHEDGSKIVVKGDTGEDPRAPGRQHHRFHNNDGYS